MNPDLEWAFAMYGQFADGGEGIEERMYYLSVAGEPWSKQRPRFDTKRGRMYQNGDDAKAEQRMRTFLKSRNPEPFTGNAMLGCLFYRSNHQRIDADNMLKHVADSAIGVLWADDSQVTMTFAEVMFDKERPRTIIVAGNHWSSLKRGSDHVAACENCGGSFVPSGTKRFCSTTCSYESRTTRLDPRLCPQCGREYAPRTRTQATCSRTCHALSLVAKRRATATPLSSCAECGRQLAHRRGGRCRDCWRANPHFYETEEVRS